MHTGTEAGLGQTMRSNTHKEEIEDFDLFLSFIYYLDFDYFRFRFGFRLDLVFEFDDFGSLSKEYFTAAQYVRGEKFNF